MAAAAFILFTITCARTLTFGDSGELIAAAWRFGLPHPPGYPLYSLLAGGVLHAVPFGEPALRTNLLSALFASLAAGLVASWARALTGSVAGGIAAAGVFTTSLTVWLAATETEVYALHALLLVALLGSCWRLGRAEAPARPLLGASALLGIGLAHHPTIVLTLPACAILAAPARPRPRHLALAAAIATAIPLASYASLYARALHDPGAWGGVDTIAKLADHVLAIRYRPYDLGWAGLARAAGWSNVASLLARSLALTGLLAALVGALRLPRRERWALVLLGLAGVAFALRYATEDVDAFLLPAIVAAAMLAAGAVPATRRAGAVAAALLVAIPLATNFRRADRSGDRAAKLYAVDLLATVPRGGTLFTDGDDAFVLAYAVQVLGERPDITLVDRRRNLFDSVRAYARLGSEIDAVGRARGEVSFMGWPGYELSPAHRFEPRGLLFGVAPAAHPPGDDAELWARYHETEIVASARRRPGVFADAVAATYPLMRGEEALARGRSDEAARELDEAARRAPGSETVLNTIGTTWARRGEIRRAVGFFERAVAAKPQSRRGWLNLARARAMLGDARGAEAARVRAESLARKAR